MRHYHTKKGAPHTLRIPRFHQPHKNPNRHPFKHPPTHTTIAHNSHKDSIIDTGSEEFTYPRTHKPSPNIRPRNPEFPEPGENIYQTHSDGSWIVLRNCSGLKMKIKYRCVFSIDFHVVAINKNLILLSIKEFSMSRHWGSARNKVAKVKVP